MGVSAANVISNDVPELARVVELERQGRYSRALRLIAATEPRTSTPAWLAARGRLLTSQGRLVDALATIDLAVDRWPGVAAVHAARAELLTSWERNAEAIVDADRAIALDDTDPVAHRARALALTSIGELEAGIRAAQRGAALAPDDPDNQMALLMALWESSPTGALAHADDLVRQRGDGWALALRAMTRLVLGVEGSPGDADTAMKLDPENETVHLTSLTVGLAGERWDEVIVGSLVEPLRDNLSATFLRAMAHLSTGRSDEAIAELAAVIAQQPGNITALEQLRQAQVNCGQWDHAAETCTRILVLRPDDMTALIIRARARCETNRPAVAIDDLDAVLAQEPRRWEALAIRSLAHLLLGQHTKAMGDAEAAYAGGAGSDSVAADARVLALLALDRRREAEDLARVILNERPGDEVASAVLAARNARWDNNLESVLTLVREALRFITG